MVVVLPCAAHGAGTLGQNGASENPVSGVIGPVPP
jgi:hypothetical protein